MYAGNYLNWYYDPTNRTIKIAPATSCKDVATSLANSIDNVNLGLMRYSNNGGFGETVAEGGMVMQPVTDIANSRTDDHQYDQLIPAGRIYAAVGNSV